MLEKIAKVAGAIAAGLAIASCLVGAVAYMTSRASETDLHAAENRISVEEAFHQEEGKKLDRLDGKMDQQIKETAELKALVKGMRRHE